MPKYQVQYKNNSQVFRDNIHAQSEVQIINLFQDLINAELLEIREYVYENKHYPKDDGNYIKSVSCSMTSELGFLFNLKIPKMKRNITQSRLTQFILDYVKINNKKPKTLKISHNF